MTTINLLQKPQDGEGKVTRSSNGGFVFSISILGVVLLALVGLNVLGSIMTTRSQKLAEKVSMENAGLIGQNDIEKVVDMQVRILEIKKSFAEKVDINNVLDNLGAEMVSGITVKNFAFSDNNKVSISFVGSSFVDASRQILKLKKSDFFANSNLSNISRTESGISFDVELSLK